MSSGFNQAIVLGRLVSLPERISTKSGSLMLRALIEVGTYRRGSDGKGEEVKTRLPVTLFGKLAETLEAYVEPGDLLQLVGRLDGFQKTGKDGKPWLTLNFVAEQLILLPNDRKDHPSTPAGRPQIPPAQSRPEPARRPVTRNELDGIPF